MSLNRTAIVAAVAEEIGDKAAATKAVTRMVETIQEALADGERVHITGLGTFQAFEVPSRMVRNPATGKKVRAKKTGRVRFRPAGVLKEYIAGKKKVPSRKRRR